MWHVNHWQNRKFFKPVLILLDGGHLVKRYPQALHAHDFDGAELRRVPPLEDALPVDEEAHVGVHVGAQVRGRRGDVGKQRQDGLRELHLSLLERQLGQRGVIRELEEGA